MRATSISPAGNVISGIGSEIAQRSNWLATCVLRSSRPSVRSRRSAFSAIETMVGAVTGVVGAVALVPLRRRTVLAQTAVAAMVPVGAVAIGVVGAASAMFISTHDLHALLVVLVAAGTVAVFLFMGLAARHERELACAKVPPG